ncbi:MAG: class I SAM-dependent RNA methyltransferase [Sphaerochaetaceae bacterium]
MIVEVDVEKLISKGLGLARYDNRALFIKGALEGEKVKVKLSKSKKDYLEATLVEIVKPSKNRVKPICEYYGVCGGCDLQHLEHHSQIDAKEKIIKENFLRIGKIDLDKNNIKIENSSFADSSSYRHRVRFHIDKVNNKVGFLEAKSKNVVDIKYCPIITDSLNSFLNENRETLLKLNKNQVRVFDANENVSVEKDEVHYELLGKRLYLDATLFFQSNRYLLENLINFVKENVTENNIADLYAGVGTFSAFIEGATKNTYAVENNKNALYYAKKNLKYTKFFTRDVEKWPLLKSIECVVIDPPRVGLDKSVIKTIGESNVKQIVYISCDSATLARDCHLFNEFSFKIKKMKMFDFYPHTSHIESGVVLKR